MRNDQSYRYFVKSLFYGWREVGAEQYKKFVDHIRQNATGMTADKKEKYIQEVTRTVPRT